MLRTDQFTCDRCTILTQCESCKALERAFRAAPMGRNWEDWARNQPIDPEPKRLLVAIAQRVDEHGYVQDGLGHFARDAGMPKYEGASERQWNRQEMLNARWAWRLMRELLAARVLEVRWASNEVAAEQAQHAREGWSRGRYAAEVGWVDEVPTSILWVRLKDREADPVWRKVA